jgi:hypothetical protein
MGKGALMMLMPLQQQLQEYVRETMQECIVVIRMKYPDIQELTILTAMSHMRVRLQQPYHATMM